jgi:hypothetical protein
VRVEWIHLAQDKNRSQVVVGTVMGNDGLSSMGEQGRFCSMESVNFENTSVSLNAVAVDSAIMRAENNLHLMQRRSGLLIADGEGLNRTEGRGQTSRRERTFPTCKLKTPQMSHRGPRNKEARKQNRNGMGQTFKIRQEDNVQQQM